MAMFEIEHWQPGLRCARTGRVTRLITQPVYGDLKEVLGRHGLILYIALANQIKLEIFKDMEDGETGEGRKQCFCMHMRAHLEFRLSLREHCVPWWRSDSPAQREFGRDC